MVQGIALLVVCKYAVQYADNDSAVRKLQSEEPAFHLPKLLLVFQSLAPVLLQLLTFTENAAGHT